MSLQVDCYGCSAGDHSKHDPTAGLLKGVIGGTYCACSGDCADRSELAAARLRRMLQEAMNR